MKKAICTVLRLTAAFLLICLPCRGEDLRVLWHAVHDSPGTKDCPSYGSTFIFKGDSNGALSPGERVFLEFTVQNRTGYNITKLYGSVIENSDYIWTYNYACTNGDWGPRFFWPDYDTGAPLVPNGLASNVYTTYDPFVVELFQSVPCDEFIDFTLTIKYQTDAGPCSTAECELTYPFSLPVFAVTQGMVVGSEETLYASTENRFHLFGTSNRGDVGLFWVQGDPVSPGGTSIYFARQDLDGNSLQDPTDLGVSPRVMPFAPPFSVLWSYPRYEAYYATADGIYWAGWDPYGGAPQSGPITSCTDTQALAAVFNPEGADAHYGEIGLIEDCGGIINILRVKAMHAIPSYWEFHTVMDPFGNADDVELASQRVAIGYMPSAEPGVSPGQYFVAWEQHTTVMGSPVDRLVLQAYNAGDLISGPVHSGWIDLPSTPERKAASPTLAVNPGMRRVAVAWKQYDGDGQQEIHLEYLGDDLQPAEPLFALPQRITDTPAYLSAYAHDPKLIFNGNRFQLLWKETIPGTIPTSIIHTGELHPDGASIWTPLLSDIRHVSGSRIAIDTLEGFPAFDDLHVYWNDKRDSYPYLDTLHRAVLTPIHSEVPRNANREDDTPLWPTYEGFFNPTLVSGGSRFLISYWRHGDAGDPIADEIYVSEFLDDGAPGSYAGQRLRQYLTPASSYQDWALNPHAIINTIPTEHYEVFYRGAEDSSPLYRCLEADFNGMWGCGSPTGFAFQGGAGSIMDVEGNGMGFGALVKDLRSGDQDYNLYLVDASTTDDPVQLTALADPTKEVYDAAIASGLSANWQWAAVWTETVGGGPWPVVYFQRFAYDINGDLAPWDPSPIALYTPPLQSDATFRWVDIAANGDKLVVVSNIAATGFGEQLILFAFDLDEQDPGAIQAGSCILDFGNEMTIHYPRVTWTGTRFVLSYLKYAGQLYLDPSPPAEAYMLFNFIRQELDYYGNPLYWPVRISTVKIKQFPTLPDLITTDYMKFDYATADTVSGGVAVYVRDVDPDTTPPLSNIYWTLLGWSAGSLECSIYNTPPVANAHGPYSVEYGQTVTLSGTYLDDEQPQMIGTRGWDLTVNNPADPDEPRFADQLSSTLPLTATLQQQYGMAVPGVYNISYLAEDTQGGRDWDDTTLTITDTTPPTVYVTHPNGGETFHGGETIPVTWEGSDNFRVDHWDVHYCTTWPNCPAVADWHAIQTGINPWEFSVAWTIPVDALSATTRIRVQGVDDAPSPNTGTDHSDGNFYLVQPTTTSYRTVVLWDSYRLCAVYDPSATTCNCADWRNDSDCSATRDLNTKLGELTKNTKVLGTVLDLTDWRNGNSSIQTLYSDWDANPTDPGKTNAVASAIRDYLHDPSTGQIAKVFTNTQFIQLVGDDRQIPFYRMTDGTMLGTYSESVYPSEVAISTATTVGSALAGGYFLTDNYYSESDPEATGLDSPHEWAYQNDYAIGRLVETPDQIAGVINVFIEQDGQLNYFEPSLKTLTTGFTFVYDAALAIKDIWAGRATSSVECLLENPLSEDTETDCMTVAGTPTTDFYYDPAAMNDNLFGLTKHKIAAILSHANHYAFSTSPEAVPASNYNYCTDPSYDAGACGAAGIDAQSSTNLRGGLVYTSGCHSGLSIPNGTALERDLPEAMAKKGVAAYIGNTGYGWAIAHGKGLTESLLIGLTNELMDAGSIAIGRALAEAKRNYYLEEKRYDVFDEKVLHELTLYGIPNYLIVTSQARAGVTEEKLPAPDGPDHGCANGVCLDKALRTTLNAGLPDGMTQLDLDFQFANIGPYQKVEVCEDKDGTAGCDKGTTDVYFGEYWTLNGYASGETGDAIQPKFVYNSTLSGLEHHGVLFTGGTIDATKTDPTFTPLGAVPLATPNTPNPGAGPLPSQGAFVPTLRSSVSPSGGLTLRDWGEGKELNMVVHTGYCTDYNSVAKTCTEQVYQDMQFSVFYHMNSTDTTAPVVTAWDEATYATAEGLAIAISDDGTPAEAPLSIAGTLVGITDINVLINLQHTRDADLKIELVAPDATAVTLSYSNGGDGADYGLYTAPDTYKYTIFDEGATVPVAEGMAPFKGTYRPQGSFAALLGEAEPVSGTWTLRVTDLNPGNATSGEIKAWKITFNERYHELEGQTATFKAKSAETDLYRVLVTYLDGGLATPKWQSVDLVKNPVSGFWEGSATLIGNTQYMVQAVDTAGNIGQVVESGQDHSVAGSGGIKYGSTWEYAKTFTIPRGDADGLLDSWEDQYSACLDSNKADTDGNGIPDAADDPDYDELTNLQEYTAGTNPCVADTDGDGDNDGSELTHGKNPLVQGDGDWLTIGLANLGGGNVLLSWPRSTDTGTPAGTPCSPVAPPTCNAVGENNLIDGHFRVYVSMDMRFDPADLAYGPDGDTDDVPYDLDRTDQREYQVLHASLPPEYQAAPILYFNTFNWDILSEPPLIETILRSGSNPLAFTIYGRYFHPTGAQTLLCESAVTCAVPVPMTESYRSTDRIQATAPGGTTGTKYIAVQNPDGLIHIWSTPYPF